MADVSALIVIFGMPVAIVGMTQYFRFKTRALAAGKDSGEKQRELEGLQKERKQLEARVQNLESIVCSVEFELNARLNRLAASQSAVGALPPAKPKPALLPAGGGEAPAGTARVIADPRAPNEMGTSPTVASPMRAAFAESPLGPGERIAGRYTLERELGHGGMGFVFLARDEQLGERVALKVISQTMASDPAAAAERFRREVAAARKITHPNVIRIHDLIEDGARLLLSMEYVDGMTLAAYLGRVGALRLDEARHLLGQMCDGLGAAHAAGVIHRDLKPGNILIDGEKRVKLIDFGLAKASFLAGMTATGLILGTPEYMAPEQVRGLPCDTRTDLYSLGALAYHLLVGRPPFSGETPIAIGFAHVTEQPRPPRDLRPELPATIDAALLKALAKNPADRFLDASELKRALTA